MTHCTTVEVTRTAEGYTRFALKRDGEQHSASFGHGLYTYSTRNAGHGGQGAHPQVRKLAAECRKELLSMIEQLDKL